jgi:hypothetical protein
MNKQAAKPRVVVKLWKSQVEQPKYNLADPSMTIFDKVTSMCNNVLRFQFILLGNACSQIVYMLYQYFPILCNFIFCSSDC